MRRAALLVRVLIELAFGFSCLSALLLCSYVWRGLFPQLFVVGLLGMPRHFNDPAVMQWFNVVLKSAGWLFIVTAVASGLLWFTDSTRLLQRLRARSRT